jgi:hypothetical protein
MHGGDEKSIQNFHHKFLKEDLGTEQGYGCRSLKTVCQQNKTNLHGSQWAPMVGG